MRARLLLLPVLFAVAAATGCDPKGVLAPNTPPETQLFVQFDPNDTTGHTVHHSVRLHWLGTDADGDVVAYEFRFLTTGDPDGAWQRTTKTDSLFVVPAPTDTVTFVFEVRAIDDAGSADPTPARQDLSLRNQAPTVTLLTPPLPRDTTYASMTLRWTGIDPDGNANDLRYRIWLDGADPAQAPLVTGSTYTIPSDAFLIDGHWSSRPRTVSVQAVDAGGYLSNIARASWFVRAPVPDTTRLKGVVLLVDDHRNAQPSGTGYDNFYRNAVTQSAAGGHYSILRLEVNQPFRSPADVLQTFRLFDAVVWYRGAERAIAASPGTNVLRTYQNTIGEYVSTGGRFYLESLDMVEGPNASGLLTEAFMRTYLGSDKLHLYRYQVDSDSSADWGIAQVYTDSFPVNGGWVERRNDAILRSSLFADSLKSLFNSSGLRGFVVRDTGDVVLWARDSVLSQRPTFDVPVAVQATHSGGGKIIAVSTPIAPLNGFNSTLRFVLKLLNSLITPGS